jgi:Uma2 family endonuclease
MALAPDDLHRFTVDEYLTIVASGDPRWEHTELIEGFVYDMSPEHLLHAEAVMAVIAALLGAKREDETVLTSVSVRFNDLSLPQPDVVLFRGTATEKLAPLPGPLVRLAVEVSVTTRAKDGGPKRDLYARSGVAEYWLVIPAEHHLLRHRDPVDDAYSTIERVECGDDLGAVVIDLITRR